jgi:hypothetical protein
MKSICCETFLEERMETLFAAHGPSRKSLYTRTISGAKCLSKTLLTIVSMVRLVPKLRTPPSPPSEGRRR